MVGEGIDMVMGAVDKGGELLWTAIALLEVESMIGIEVSRDEHEWYQLAVMMKILRPFQELMILIEKKKECAVES